MVGGSVHQFCPWDGEGEAELMDKNRVWVSEIFCSFWFFFGLEVLFVNHFCCRKIVFKREHFTNL